MRKRVMAEAVAFGQFAPRDFRVRFDIAAEQEEGRQHAFVLERVEHFRGGGRPGAVVEGEHQLLVASGSVTGKLLAADPRRALGVDLEHALGAERVRIAGQGAARAAAGAKASRAAMARLRIMA